MAGSEIFHRLVFIFLPVMVCSGIGNACGRLPGAGITSVKQAEFRYRFPLKHSDGDKRYLKDQDNKPFFWSGDAAWSLIAQVSREDAEYYLDNRKEKGFSVVMVSLIEHKFSSGAPSDYYGDKPFTGRPFSTPDEKYFQHADFVIRAAAARNIAVLLAPVYLGYGCGDEGWCSEVRSATIEDMLLWGRYLGKRYRDFPNIIWLIGGDTDPLPVKDKLLGMIKGIREYDTVHLVSAHNQPGSMGVTPWNDQPWLSVNNVYSYDSAIYSQYKQAYLYSPVMPWFMIESTYENEHGSDCRQLRSQAYWAILSGAMGHIFGNCPVWHFGSSPAWCGRSDWKKELDDSGSVSMHLLQRLFRSRSWQSLIPDFDNTVLKRGYGECGSGDYATGAISSDGNTFIAYLPSGRGVTVDMSRINGTRAKCWWYDPAGGSSALIGIYRTSGTRSFTPESRGDRVLVIDNARSNLLPPGEQQFEHQER